MAQSQTKPATPSKPDPKKSKTTAALKAYDSGTRSFKSGKMDSAIKSLSSAIKTGGLSSQQMAKALYTRGLAYRKRGKPALAISDLTTSVWLKNGLSETDRAKAVVARQAAYREAGLGDTAPPVAAQKSTPGAPVAIKSAQAPAAAPPTSPIATPAAAPAVTNAPTPSWESTTTAVSTPAPVTVDNKNAVEQASSTVAGFFSNLFSPSAPQQSGSVATTPAPSSITTAAVPQQVTPPGGPANSLHAAVASTTRTPAPVPAPTVPQSASPGFSTATAPTPQPVPAAPPVTSTTVAKTPVSAPQAAPVPKTSGTGFVTTTSAQPVPAPAATAPQSTQAPAAPPSPNALEQAGAAVTGFFGNLFAGGGSTGAAATQSPSSNVATSSTGASAGPTSAVSSWSNGTEVATATSTKAPHRAPVTAIRPPPVTPAAAPARAPAQKVAALPPQAAPHGDFRLQIAAVRSRDDAARVAAQIKRDHAFRLGARQTEIDKAVIGNMGTFYRVRIGPYANAAEPRKLCTVLRPHGYDCLVVTQ